MASTTTVGSPTGTEAAHRSRARRLWMICGLLIVSCAIAIWSLGLVWYRADIGPVQIMDSSFHTTEASATAEIDGWGLVDQDPPPATDAFGTPTAPPVPASIAGMPIAAAMLLALTGFVLVGCALRLSFITGLGILVVPFAWWQNQQLIEIMTDPQTGGLYNRAGPGVAWFQAALAAALVFAVLATVQCALVNAQERRQTREAALAAGKPAPPGFFDSVWGLMARSLNRLEAAGHLQRGAHEPGS